jgi:cation diffusion facilitator family transporter
MPNAIAPIIDPVLRARKGTQAGVAGICCNLLLFGAKLTVGTIFGSVAVTADAFNNLADSSSCIVTLLGFKMSAKPADKEHPFGHGRAEYVASFLLSLMMLLVGVELGRGAAQSILRPAAPERSAVMVAVLLGSMGVKIGMGLFYRRAGNRINSDILRANTRDSFNDVAATFTVLLSALLSPYLNLPLDGIAGFLVSGFIAWGGVSLARETMRQLLGKAPDAQLVADLRAQLLSYPGILGAHDLMVHDYGAGRGIASLHAEVAEDADFIEIHEMIDRAEGELGRRFGLLVVIHMDPIARKDSETLALQQAVLARVKTLEPESTLHDFRVTKGKQHINVLFDLVVPIAYGQEERAAIQLRLENEIYDIDPRLHPHIRVESNFY